MSAGGKYRFGPGNRKKSGSTYLFKRRNTAKNPMTTRTAQILKTNEGDDSSAWKSEAMWCFRFVYYRYSCHGC